MYAALQFLAETLGLSHRVVKELGNFITVKSAPKRSLLLKQGQSCSNIYIIEKGFARIFFTVKGEDITTLFARENDIVTSTHALFTRGTSNENIELLEDSIVLKIDYHQLVKLCGNDPDFFTFYRMTMEKYYLLLEERALSLQFDTALERYEKLLSRHPFILQRAPLGQVASYLGMSPVTLSRMRRNI
jgi:CRP/FNR family transcriptional regulator, anaerobic regulatory protein